MLTQSEIRKKSRRVRDNHKAMSEKNILLVAIEFLGGSMILKVEAEVWKLWQWFVCVRQPIGGDSKEYDSYSLQTDLRSIL